MALPSQMERTAETSRPVMSRSNRKAGNNNKKIALTIGAVVVGLGIVFAAVQYLPALLNKTNPSTTDGGSAAAPPLVGTESVNDRAAANPSPQSPPTTPPVNLIPKPTRSDGVLGNAVDIAAAAKTAPPPGAPAVPATPAAAAAADPKPKPIDVTKDPSAPALAAVPPANTPAGSPAADGGSLPATTSTNQVRSLIEFGDRALAASKPLEARVAYSRALVSPDISKSDASALRDKAARLNQDLVFSAKVTPGDSISESYTVASGDALERIAKRRDLATHNRLIQRVNNITNPNALKIGQKLKLVRGPFHAVVHKSDYRLDLFWGSPDEPADWLYIRSFPVGLGAENGTPVGTFTVKKNSKLINPHWTNPKTGEKFEADDPKNPIGEFWLGWEGQGTSAVYTGFGLHGTIDPISIGSQKSMGCVRMADNDIATVWEMLAEQLSVVKVVP